MEEAHVKLIYKISKENRIGYSLPSDSVDNFEIEESLTRKTPLDMPEVTELDVVRHFTRLSQKNYGVDQGFYPLGSCTMKYNPKINEELASNFGFTKIHPLQKATSVQGALEIYYETSRLLSEITGMKEFTFMLLPVLMENWLA